MSLVAFGDEVHVYRGDDPAAVILHTTAIGANLDAEFIRLRADGWRTAFEDDTLAGLNVHDHTA
ncbi:hypothetical protein [Actinoplanes sp. NPDC026670]|uniref:hypothetical protein n=1 Tax=Actinoplanes sp. NPDC026670 TaxID=3154700 RepID=UPI0033C54303